MTTTTQSISIQGINDADYEVITEIDGKQIACHYFRVWKGMLQKCTDPNYPETIRRSCNPTIHKPWLSFMTFRAWMETQEWEGKALELNVIESGNMHYHPDTCCFVTNQIKNLLIDCTVASRGFYPIGSKWDHEAGQYSSQANDGTGEVKHLGYFDTEKAAHNAYILFLSELVTNLANEQTDPRIRDGLLRQAILSTR